MTVLAVARRYGLSWHRVMGLVLAEGRHLVRHRQRRPCRVLLFEEKSMRNSHGQFSTLGRVEFKTRQRGDVMPAQQVPASERFCEASDQILGESSDRRALVIRVSDASDTALPAVSARLNRFFSSSDRREDSGQGPPQGALRAAIRVAGEDPDACRHPRPVRRDRPRPLVPGRARAAWS